MALAAGPGLERDDLLVAALANESTLLEGEPVDEWALRPRERLEWARQEARLALARARARGLGRSGQEAVVEAWEACLSRDPTCEEAASALMRLYAAQARPSQVEAVFNRCQVALEQLGLRASPALEGVHGASAHTVGPQLGPGTTGAGRGGAHPGRAPRRDRAFRGIERAPGYWPEAWPRRITRAFRGHVGRGDGGGGITWRVRDLCLRSRRDSSLRGAGGTRGRPGARRAVGVQKS